MVFSRILLWRIIFIGALCISTIAATQALDMPNPVNNTDKIIHALAFFGLSVIAGFTQIRALIWIPILVLFGAAIELVQHTISYRSASWFDWGADLAGIVAYLIIFQIPALKGMNRWLAGGS